MEHFKEVDKEEQKKPDYKPVEKSFYFNHVWMGVTVCVTLLTAFILENPIQRDIILLESAISTISTTIYYFLTKTARENEISGKEIDWKRITLLRYNGWVLSTPIMLIAFLLFLSSTTKIKMTIPLVISIVILDWLMLLFGYLGEIGSIDRLTALIGGFIPFFAIFGIIFNTFLMGIGPIMNYVVFGLFVLFWGLYGLGYMLDLEPRNYLMNILDLSSKSGIGILFACYFLFFPK